MQEKIAIEVEGLEKEFGEVKALKGLDLKVESGQLFGLLGPNGAGKTTLISIICGLQKATSGRCSVLGQSVPEHLSEVKGKMGVCPQSGAVFGQLTGAENVELFGRLYGLCKEEAEDRAADLMEKVGLATESNRKVRGYSEGMKRRLSLAMAMVHRPELAFLDEPTVGMDPQSRRAVWELIRQYRAQGCTIVLTTHYMEEAEHLCDKVGVIDHGQLIALGSPSELISRYNKKDLEEVFIALTGRRIREAI